MNIFPPVNRAVFLVTISLSAVTTSELPAASPTPGDASLEVIATNGAGVEKHLFSQGDVVPMLMIRQNQTVPVTLQFPSARPGTQLAAVPLDGGQIGGGNLVVLPTSRTAFTFSPGAEPGRYRVMVYMPPKQYLLEFYVVDPNHPPRQQRPGSGH
jgi:hypothetical protein